MIVTTNYTRAQESRLMQSLSNHTQSEVTSLAKHFHSGPGQPPKPVMLSAAISSLSVHGSSFGPLVLAAPFTAGATATLSDIQLALSNYGDSAPLGVDLESDSGGPNTVLATLSQDGTIPLGNPGGLVTFTCTICAQLTAGTSYWIVAFPTDGGTFVGWHDSITGASSLAYNFTGQPTGPWSSEFGEAPAYQVDGAAVPEPSAVILMLTMLLGVAIVTRNRIARGLGRPIE
jgi:hypothetical protein